MSADPKWWRQPAAVPCEDSRAAALARQQTLTKPPGSLGRLETLASQLAALQRRARPAVESVQIRVFAADHGVVAEGVSAFPQSVTAQMIGNFARGGAAIAVLAQLWRADFAVVDLGTVSEVPDLPGVIARRVAPGTANFCTAPAMSHGQFDAALEAGAREIDATCDLFIGGDMGIGNTTAAAALTCALLDLPVGRAVGRGTGVDDVGLARKRRVVQRALQRHGRACTSPQEALRRLGGLEIVALAGAFIAAAQTGVAVLVDGYICTVAAFAACQMNPGVRAWLLFAHRSAEPGHGPLLEALDAEPLLDLGMRLGEGSGAAIALPLLVAACRLHDGMATFAGAGVSGGDGP